MIPVFICSPYSGDVENNVNYAEKVCRRASLKGYAPYAPHLFCTRFLNDQIPNERRAGMLVGKEFMNLVDEVWICSETISKGMEEEIRYAISQGMTIRFYNELTEARLI